MQEMSVEGRAASQLGRPVGMRIGFMTMQCMAWTELVETWQALERWGAESIWVCDHLVNRWNPASVFFEGWTTLAALAALTRRARIGMLVSPPTLHHPAPLAQQAVTVDHISGGRLELGLGSGGAPLDQRIMGLDPWSRRERCDRFDEFVRLLARLLVEDVDDQDGYYRVHSAALRPRALQAPHPPITIAGHDESAFRLAASFGSRWNSYAHELKESASASLRATERRIVSLEKACEAAGRSPGEITRSLLLPFGRLAATPLASREAWDAFVARYREIGVDEIIFFYPLDVHFAADAIEPGLLQEIIRSP
jgi:alkanesulfonate monooxygenase SsuD/methylene tetrahydromethanopterin reductase-like flavin-dependent oxidoreductase (luciferase family)